MFLLLFAASVTAETMTVNVASVFPPDSVADKALVKFKELVEERSSGQIEILLHSSGSMGNEVQIFGMLSQGSIEYGVVGGGEISYYYPEYYIFTAPYLLTSQDLFWKFWKGPGKEIDELMEKERGVRMVGLIFRGAEYLTSNKPIRSVADMKGLKLRMYSVKHTIKAWESLGAIVSQIEFSELYLALKTGIVDAQVNPPETILSYKFYEAQKYLIATKAIHWGIRIESSVKWWNTLNKDDQTLLTKAMDESVAYANTITKDGDDKYVKKLQELGMILIEVDNDAFKQAMLPALEKIVKEEANPVFYEKMMEALQ